MPSGLEHRLGEVVGERHAGRRRDGVGGQLDAGVGVDPPPLRRGDRLGPVERVAAGVGEQVAQRAAGLADGSSSATMPSSTATSVAHAASGLVSDARRKRWSTSPTVPATVPSAATTAAPTCRTGHVETSSRACSTVQPRGAGDQLGDPERQVEALAGVQPGVAHRLVAVVEVGVGHGVGAAEALGDVLAGQLDVDAARPRALGPVGPDEPGDLARRCRRSGGSCGRSAR